MSKTKSKTPPAPEPGLKGRLAAAACAALVNIVLFWPTLGFSPVMLDEVHLLDEKWAAMRAPGYAARAFRQDAFGTRDIGFYRPLLSLTFMADARMSGEKPGHAAARRTNLALQALAAALAALLLAELGFGPVLAAGGALAFSLHPALAGAAGWLPGRNDSLLFCAAALSLLALGAALRRRSPALFALHLALFLSALLTKESAAALALVFPAWAASLPAHGERRPGARLWAAAAFCWAACLAAYWLLRSGAVEAPAAAWPGLAELLRRGSVYAAALSVPVPFPPFGVFSDLAGRGLYLAASAGAAALAALWAFRRGRLIPAALAAAALFTAPALLSDRFQPHRLYLPAFCLALVLADAVRGAAPRHTRAGAAALFALALAFGLLTGLRALPRFSGPEAFWGAAEKYSPSSPEAAWVLGYSAHLRGDTGAAEKYYLKVLALNPLEPDARNNLGLIYAKAGRAAEARALFESELRLRPDNVLALANFASLLAGQGNWSAAASLYRRRLELLPADANTAAALAACLYRSGRASEARGVLDRYGLSGRE